MAAPRRSAGRGSQWPGTPPQLTDTRSL